MYAQSNNVILLSIGMMLLMIIVLMQCASGKRTKKANLSNTKSNVTQPSVSSSQSVRRSRELQKKKMKRDVENSLRSLSKRQESIQKSSVSKRSQTDESLPSSKSEALKSSSQSIGPLEKEKSVNASTEIPGKSITMIPKVTTRTSKDMQVAKLTDEKSKSNEEVKGTMIKEQKQNIQENNGLTDEKEELSIEPKNLRWTGDGGYQTVQLRNITTDRLAVKAKCSDNELYRVNPVFGFIDPGKELKVDIIRRKAIPKVDKMIFVSVRANKEEVFPKPLFKRSKDSQKMAMLPLLVARVI
uniref:Major sperm protein n=1 Tax=Onchocerca volvulus TaxID=6282 RepID=A0A8R1TL49_ONCVO